jgi:hypothetical protein
MRLLLIAGVVLRGLVGVTRADWYERDGYDVEDHHHHHCRQACDFRHGERFVLS